MEGESEAPCHSGESVCGCDTMSERWQAVAVKSRDENTAPAIALEVSGASAVERHLLFARSDPPDRQFHTISFYDGIHGRSARLLI
jgi:4-aminobutyrate aminotransferase-like enzyme